VLNTDLQSVRAAWMAAMSRRTDSRFIDGQLMGHALNSASFFASANLILIAAAAGVLFGGQDAWRRVSDFGILADAPRQLFELKLGLVTLALSRGLLDFIWSIRQMNYTFAVIGAAPEKADPEVLARYGEAAAALLNPAMSSFNAGVRGYYFALAAAAWLVGPIPFVIATLGATGLLFWRQSSSKAARAVRAIRDILADPRTHVSTQPELPADGAGQLADDQAVRLGEERR
jgi:uncharacterized membrane protein